MKNSKKPEPINIKYYNDLSQSCFTIETKINMTRKRESLSLKLINFKFVVKCIYHCVIPEDINNLQKIQN